MKSYNKRIARTDNGIQIMKFKNLSDCRASVREKYLNISSYNTIKIIIINNYGNH
jgi:hypothetical protein